MAGVGDQAETDFRDDTETHEHRDQWVFLALKRSGIWRRESRTKPGLPVELLRHCLVTVSLRQCCGYR